jgi:acetoin utilization deacetylase AcuC-like enzyme
VSSARKTFPVFYGPAYVLGEYAFETTRKARWVAESLRADPIAGVRLVEPEASSFDDLAAVHDPRYVAAVRDGAPRELAESQGFPWDEGLWRMVLATNGGVVAAARAALAGGVAGSLSSGLHHARREHGSAFCTFNGLVLAARAALGDGAGCVLILDLDAHCGGGTASMIAGVEGIWHCDVAASSFDRHDPAPRQSLAVVSRAAEYLSTIERLLEEISAAAPAFGLCLYNAGMDPFEGCSIGGRRGVDREMLSRREALVFSWCRSRAIPVAFVLAGGYKGPDLDEAGLVALHRLTIEAAAG